VSILVVEPTPVQRAEHVSSAVGHEVWIKRDDLTHPRYGGNKLRKLVHLLADARARGATDLLTVGSVGSHHVLATAVHGRAFGLAVHAIVAPQPRTAHAVQTARASVAKGARLLPVGAGWQAPARAMVEVAALRAQGRRVYLLGPGGTSPLGTVGYLEAMRELAAQVAGGALPGWPDVVVCALGSGGTYAGLLAGARACGAPCKVVGVRITAPWMTSRPALAWLAGRAWALAEPGRGRARIASREVQVVSEQLGRGYGYPTEAGREAQALFARDGVALDPIYTAKAAAGLLALARHDPTPRRYLFWHTLSSAPLAPLLDEDRGPLPPTLDALFRDEA
jgi:1-aminocyclopropane-1-carboxylate deaminase/D-cysteine desulfhydrase-like pyridoxal-dependent ACC family enzyme